MRHAHDKTVYPDLKNGLSAGREWLYKITAHRRIKVWQRLFQVLVFTALLLLTGTAVVDFDRDLQAARVERDSSGWENPVYAYVVAEQEGVSDVQLYTEGLSPLCLCGRGINLEMESWEPFIADDGSEFYHVWYEGQYAYIPVENISSDASRVLQESQVYVRTVTNLYVTPDGLDLGALVEKGTALNVLDYDYLEEDGTVHMYRVKCGDEQGWIRSEYVVLSFMDAMDDGMSGNAVTGVHGNRGDVYGGGSPSELDYFPREKGDFEDNIMPEACYCIHIPGSAEAIQNIDSYLELAEGTEINTFVFTVSADYQLACPFRALDNLGLENSLTASVSREEFQQAVAKVKQAGYYVAARISVFQDSVLAEARPSLAYAQADGSLLKCSGIPWLSVFSRAVWKLRVEMALEAVESFGFNEIMFDGLLTPYGLTDYEAAGADLKNSYDESYAQALQRFLMYAADVLHDHDTYVSAVAMSDCASTYVTFYGQYWPAFSNVADAICATVFPEDYSNYWTSAGYYIAYKHPYQVVSEWADRAERRQEECSTPAKARTWIQCWDCSLYDYDSAAIQREILALYDSGLADGYGAWSSVGSLDNYRKMLSCFTTDYTALYLQAEQQEQELSEFMGVSTEDTQEEESE